jgi:hypothetical protein
MFVSLVVKTSCPTLPLASTSFLKQDTMDVDGRDKPGDDDGNWQTRNYKASITAELCQS